MGPVWILWDELAQLAPLRMWLQPSVICSRGLACFRTDEDRCGCDSSWQRSQMSPHSLEPPSGSAGLPCLPRPRPNLSCLPSVCSRGLRIGSVCVSFSRETKRRRSQQTRSWSMIHPALRRWPESWERKIIYDDVIYICVCVHEGRCASNQKRGSTTSFSSNPQT